MNIDSRNIISKIEVIEHKLQSLSDMIEAERRDSNEDDYAVMHELLEKKSILSILLTDLKQNLSDNLTKKQPEMIGKTYILENDFANKTVSIVNIVEVDPRKGKISYESPLAKALEKGVKGEEIKINTPVGTTNYKILEIS